MWNVVLDTPLGHQRPVFFSRGVTVFDRPGETHTITWVARLHVMGGLHIELDEDDLLGNTATFQVSMSSGHALQPEVRNLSLPKQVHVLHQRLDFDQPHRRIHVLLSQQL